MIHTFADILLCEIRKNSLFRENHAQHGVYVLNAALLVAVHWITVINAGTDTPLRGGFQAIGITKLLPTVGQYNQEQAGKVIGTA